MCVLLGGILPLDLDSCLSSDVWICFEVLVVHLILNTDLDIFYFLCGDWR